jgi:hypothetical protein
MATKLARRYTVYKHSQYLAVSVCELQGLEYFSD